MRFLIALGVAAAATVGIGCGTASKSGSTGDTASTSETGDSQAVSMGGEAGVSGGEAGTTKDAVGAPCTLASECPIGGSGSAACLTEWPGGYCAVRDCTPHGHDCPGDPGQGSTATTGGKCVLAPTAICLALCAADTDCRPGYACQARDDAAGHGSANVCAPASPSSQPTGGHTSSDGGGMGGSSEEHADGGMMGSGGM